MAYNTNQIKIDKRLIIGGVILLLVLLLVIPASPVSAFYVLEEGEQVIVTRFGKVVHTDDQAGLKVKVPVVDTPVFLPKKLITWDAESRIYPTLEKQNIYVDATARWRISDLEQFYVTLKNTDAANDRLNNYIADSIRGVISTNSLSEAVRNSNNINIATEATGEEQNTIEELNATQKEYPLIYRGRDALSQDITERTKSVVEANGIEIIDITIRQIRYEDLEQSVYERMIQERLQVAAAYRSNGEGKRAEWLGRLENEKKKIISEAYATSEKIKGEADAEAVQIYGDAYSKDIEFFEFWRTIESYKTVLPNLDKTLSTDFDYFQYLYSPMGNSGE